MIIPYLVKTNPIQTGYNYNGIFDDFSGLLIIRIQSLISEIDMQTNQIDCGNQFTIEIDLNAGQLLFRLHKNQFRQIFRYLTLRDLLSFRQTSTYSYINAHFLFEGYIEELNKEIKHLDKRSTLIIHQIMDKSFNKNYLQLISARSEIQNHFIRCYIKWKHYYRYNQDLFDKIDLQWNFILEMMVNRHSLNVIRNKIKHIGIRKLLSALDIQQEIRLLKGKFFQQFAQTSGSKKDCYKLCITQLNEIESILQTEYYSQYKEMIIHLSNALLAKKKAQKLATLLQSPLVLNSHY